MKNVEIFQRVYERILREADLGDIEFSPNRTDGVSNDEPNTPEEEELYNDLKYWVIAERASDTLPDTVKTLLDDPKYNHFFIPPRSDETMYRGVGLTASELQDLIGRPPGAKGTANGKFKIDLIKPVASWTRNYNVAEYFAGAGAVHGRYCVVLTARAGDNPGQLLDLEVIVKKIDRLASWAYEEEILALGEVTAIGVEWWTR